MNCVFSNNWPLAVLFDLDGTLVDTHIDFTLMRNEMLRLALENDVWDDTMTKMDILAIIDTSEKRLSEFQKFDDAKTLRQDAYEILKDIEMRHAKTAVEVPGARNLLESLKSSGISTGIVTRNCRVASLLSMEVVGIEVDVMITREDTDRHKPLPEPVLIALSKMNYGPANAVMIGDHPMDVQSGKSAGCYTVGFLREDRQSGFFDAVCPDMIITSLGELSFAANNIHS